MREDRSPGGKHRHKRQRLDGSGSTDDPLLGPPDEDSVMDFEDKLTTDLINAHPEIIPPSDGTWNLILCFHGEKLSGS